MVQDIPNAWQVGTTPKSLRRYTVKEMKKKNKGNLRRVRIRLSNGAGFYVKWSFPKRKYRSLTDPTSHRFWTKP